jgi:hypothetical protein
MRAQVRRLSLLRLSAALVLAAAAIAQARPTGDSLPHGIARLLGYEQKLLSRDIDTVRVSSTANFQDPRYSPEQGRRFDVKSYWIDAGGVHAHTAEGLPEALRARFFRTVGGKRQVLLLVHPESEQFYAGITQGAERGEDFTAAATASSRTLLIWPKGDASAAFFGKLSLDREVGNVVRTIPGSEVARSLGVNNALFADRSRLPDTFHYFPEVLGVIPKGMDRGGMIIRAIPPEIASGAAHFVPLFSLYAPTSDGSPPLIVRMIQRSGVDAGTFVRERILRPFVRQWWQLVLDHHAVPEPHAQNVLLEMGPDGLPKGGFLHRDLGGFRLDLEARAARGLPRSDLPIVNNRSRDYKENEWKANLTTSLDNYFDGGFVHNLDAKLPIWATRYGFAAGFSEGDLGRQLIQIVEEEFTAKTGIDASLRGSLNNLPKLVARAHKASGLTSGRGSIVQRLAQKITSRLSRRGGGAQAKQAAR